MTRDTMLSMTAPPVLQRGGPAASAFASVEATRDCASVLAAWAELESVAPCSIYQTRAWILPWVATLGRLARLDPLYVLARSEDGTPTALLCLGTRRHGPFRIASFLGARDSNLNLALLRQPAAWSASELRRLLLGASAALGSRAPHAFVFCNQPLVWQGRDNPFAAFAHQASPSAAYGATLPSDAEAFFAAKLSKESRKKLRKKEAKLAAFGPVRHLVVADRAQQQRVLDAFLAQKLVRFLDKGISSQFDAPEMRAFFEAASPPNGQGIELHALLVGERIVATYGGAAHAGQWSGMVNSFDQDEDIAKASPGDILLMRIVADACARGLTRFDLGIGEARYKAALCDEPIALFDCVVAPGWRGAPYGAYVRLRQGAKRVVKRHPALMALVRRLRARA